MAPKSAPGVPIQPISSTSTAIIIQRSRNQKFTMSLHEKHLEYTHTHTPIHTRIHGIYIYISLSHYYDLDLYAKSQCVMRRKTAALNHLDI